ncbi:phosphate ABC transporter ATP-binding protein [Candidatus Phyllobacterium onerii]|uniref:ABC transporter ATP-binding protein n=1 Tax=Candidatus Phyllobacterium onerii TaxID=3020828 RepID=UPI00232C0208|nr:phosphate ABC transporter ATP-binding protein [Phyllobacterium sp. IY22]
MHGSFSILPLRAEGLTYNIAGRALVDDISFEIARGTRTIIMGPNGAGKSLTLRLCHGLLKPTLGSVTWNGAAYTEGRKRHAMVFQRPVMLRRSALANLTHALSLTRSSPRDALSRANEALARFGLVELARRPARILSGGEQQRLAMARAWALDPEVLFLDEPTSALDPTATRAVEDMIKAFHADGMTILMTTHDLGQAQRLADEVLFLHRGRILEQTPAKEFFERPRSDAARAFINGELLW